LGSSLDRLEANVTISLPLSSVVNGTMVNSTSIPNSSFAGSFSVRRPSTRMTSSSSTSPTPTGTNASPVGPLCGAPGGKPRVVHATRVPCLGSSSSDVSPALHVGQRGWAGNAVAPQLPHRLPIKRGLSSGQVEMSGASAFCMA